ncbi:hypothetical protein Hanom_Chr05g00462811 [Helianthus anomalus]
MQALIYLLLLFATQDHWMTRTSRVAMIVSITSHHQVNEQGFPPVAYGLHKSAPSPPSQGRYRLCDPCHPSTSNK